MLELKDYTVVTRELAFFRASEEVVAADVETLAHAIASARQWQAPLPVERSSGIIMDGNHRWHAARLLGLRRLPCILLDYADARVRVVDWTSGQAYPVARIFQTIEAGQVLPYKSTRHSFAPLLPATAIPLDQLFAAGATPT